jgi:hypothetical protein
MFGWRAGAVGAAAWCSLTPFRKLFLVVVAICTAAAIGTPIASKLHPEWIRSDRDCPKP